MRSGLDWIGYLRADQFLDHLTVIIMKIAQLIESIP